MTKKGPFENAVEAGVGFSDAALLAVSFVGFVMLAVTLYSLILTRLQSAEELEGGEEELDYDEKLDRADVATLNRAQRRLRAKNRMKKQRRIAPAPVPEGGNQNNDEGDQQEEANEKEETRHLSRKERQKAAKAAEREERRLNEDQRREMQRQAMEAAQRERREREQLEAQRAEEGRRLREQEKKSQEEAEYDAWNTFLTGHDGTSVSVQQFLSTVKTAKVVLVDDYADQLRVSSEQVIDRIRELQSDNRVTGVLDGRGRFFYVTADEMNAFVAFIKEKEDVSLKELSDASGDLMVDGRHVPNDVASTNR